jgi:hypothetical protein
MPTVIDELIVKLGLDSKDLVNKSPQAKKQLDDLDEGAKDLAKSTKSAAGGLSEVAGKLGAFLALLGGTAALKDFVRDTIETNTQLHYLAANLGMAVRELSSWGTVAEEFGGSAKGLQATLSHLSMEATNFALRGQSSLIPFLSMMGIKFDQAHPDNVLLQIAGWVQKAQAMGLARPAVHNILQQMGIDEGTINAMWGGTAALKAYLEQAGKLAATDAEAKHAAQAKAQLVILGAQFAKIGYDLLEKAYPALEKFIALLQKFGAWVREHETIAGVFSAITLAVIALAGSAGVLSLALGALSAFAPEAILAGLGAIVAAAPEILLVAAAVAALVGGGIWIAKGFTKGKSATGGNSVNAANVPDVAQAIARQEGFYTPGTIPRRANNPGDIEYGHFAIRHGATGSMTAAGGKQIAIFPSEQAGWEAMYALLQGNYLGMNLSDALNKWQGKGTQASLLTGHRNSIAAQLAMLQSSAPAARSSSKSITNHIGEVNVYTQATDAKKMAADLGRGTDWLTFASQANSAVV